MIMALFTIFEIVWGVKNHIFSVFSTGTHFCNRDALNKSFLVLQKLTKSIPVAEMSDMNSS